jgi:hypothetical protein
VGTVSTGMEISGQHCTAICVGHFVDKVLVVNHISGGLGQTMLNAKLQYSDSGDLVWV